LITDGEGASELIHHPQKSLSRAECIGTADKVWQCMMCVQIFSHEFSRIPPLFIEGTVKIAAAFGVICGFRMAEDEEFFHRLGFSHDL
jgi:hypothetical protein